MKIERRKELNDTSAIFSNGEAYDYYRTHSQTDTNTRVTMHISTLQHTQIYIYIYIYIYIRVRTDRRTYTNYFPKIKSN